MYIFGIEYPYVFKILQTECKVNINELGEKVYKNMVRAIEKLKVKSMYICIHYVVVNICVWFQVDTPDSVLQSGLGLTDLGQHAVLRSMVDPRDYDRLRLLQMNGGTPNTFEETIYKVNTLLQ